MELCALLCETLCYTEKYSKFQRAIVETSEFVLKKNAEGVEYG